MHATTKAVKVWKVQLTNPTKALDMLNSADTKEHNPTNVETLQSIDTDTELKLNALRDSAQKISNESIDRFRSNTASLKEIVNNNKQDMKEFLYERLKIISDALRSFNIGYAEGKAKGYEDGLSKSPEDIFQEVVLPIKAKVNEHVKRAINNNSNTDSKSVVTDTSSVGATNVASTEKPGSVVSPS